MTSERTAASGLPGPEPKYPIEPVDKVLRLLLAHHGFAVQDPGTKACRPGHVVGDLARLGRFVPAGSCDLLLTSRATHHLAPEELAAFHRAAAPRAGQEPARSVT